MIKKVKPCEGFGSQHVDDCEGLCNITAFCKWIYEKSYLNCWERDEDWSLQLYTQLQLKPEKNSDLNDRPSTSRSLAPFWLVKSFFVTLSTLTGHLQYIFVQLRKINWLCTLHVLFFEKLWEQKGLQSIPTTSGKSAIKGEWDIAKTETKCKSSLTFYYTCGH